MAIVQPWGLKRTRTKVDAPPGWGESAMKTNARFLRYGHGGPVAMGQQANDAESGWPSRHAKQNSMYDACTVCNTPTEQKLLICRCDLTGKT